MTVQELIDLLQKVENKNRHLVFQPPFGGGTFQLAEKIIELDVGGVGHRYSFDIMQCVMLENWLTLRPEFLTEFNAKVHQPDRPLAP